MPLAEKVRRADYVLENDGTLAQLRERTDGVLELLCAAVNVTPARYAPPSTVR
jgi:dephospho-CoA kinase